MFLNVFIRGELAFQHFYGLRQLWSKVSILLNASQSEIARSIKALWWFISLQSWWIERGPISPISQKHLFRISLVDTLSKPSVHFERVVENFRLYSIVLTVLLKKLFIIVLNLFSYLRDQVLAPVLKVVETNQNYFLSKVFGATQMLDQIDSISLMRFILNFFH